MYHCVHHFIRTISSFHVHVVCQIDDDITAKHRQEVINTPDIAPAANKRRQTKKANAAASRKDTPITMDDAVIDLICDRLLKKLTNHIETTISTGLELCSDMSAKVTWTICYMLLRAETHLY